MNTVEEILDFAIEREQQAADFYTDLAQKVNKPWLKEMLGFELMYHMEDMGWAEVHTAVGNVTIGLSQVEKVKTGGGATLVFGVLDIDATRAELEGKGVRFDGETTVIPEMVKLATFFDTDGNTYMLSQSLIPAQS